MSKSRFTSQERLEIVKEYLGGNTSYIKLGRKYKIDESCIRQWIAKYKAFGEKAFELVLCQEIAQFKMRSFVC